MLPETGFHITLLQLANSRLFQKCHSMPQSQLRLDSSSMERFVPSIIDKPPRMTTKPLSSSENLQTSKRSRSSHQPRSNQLPKVSQQKPLAQKRVGILFSFLFFFQNSFSTSLTYLSTRGYRTGHRRCCRCSQSSFSGLGRSLTRGAW